MEMSDCQSGHISAHGYDHQTKTLGVQFKSNGAIYHWIGVEPHDYEAFKSAESLGTHLHKVIRPKFGNGVKQNVS